MIKIFKYIIISIIAIFCFFIYYIFLSPRAFNAKKNVKNSIKLEIGMDKNKMIKIMGEPDDIYQSYFDSKDTIYYYEPPFMASDGIEIYIGNNKVNRIISYR